MSSKEPDVLTEDKDALDSLEAESKEFDKVSRPTGLGTMLCNAM